MLGGWESPFQLHSGPHLGSGRVLDTKSPPNGRCAYRSIRQSGSGGSCVRGPGSPDDGVGQRATEPRSSKYIGPRVLLVRCIRAQDASFYEPKSSSSQKAPHPQVPSGGRPALSETLLTRGLVYRQVCSFLLCRRDPPTRTDGPHLKSGVMVNTPSADLASDLTDETQPSVRSHKLNEGTTRSKVFWRFRAKNLQNSVWLPLQGSP